MSTAHCMHAELALRYLKLAMSSPQPTNACSENYSSDKDAWLTFQKNRHAATAPECGFNSHHQAHNVHKRGNKKREKEPAAQGS